VDGVVVKNNDGSDIVQKEKHLGGLCMKTIDLRRDTITLPSEHMVQAAIAAELGDSVYDEDPQQVRLEELAAEITGKDASLFLPSGTMGNLVAVLTHTRRGDEVIMEENAHIFTSETGGAAALGGLSFQRIKGVDGVPDPPNIEMAVRGENIHYPRSSLICLEMSHYRYGGIVAPLEKLKEIRKVAVNKGIPIHLDGARLFNAAHYLKIDVKRITENADSVMFCLSKGLGAPVGSMLCGRADFIEEAKRYRKMMGGGMRQTGWLCACGIEALSAENLSRLQEDHRNARLLAEALNRLPEITIDLSKVHTNFVIPRFSSPANTLDNLPGHLENHDILINKPKGDDLVLVISRQVDESDIHFAAERITEFIQKNRGECR
jgi:threonine aldolase